MDNALDILHSIAVAVAVALPAVGERSRPRPGEGDKALVSIPGIYHAVKCRVRRINLEICKLSVPVINQLLLLPLHNAKILIALHNPFCCGRSILTQNKCDLLRFSRRKSQRGMQRAAAVRVVIKDIIAFAVLHCYRVAISVIISDKCCLVPIVGGYRRTCQREESLPPIAPLLVLPAILINRLDNHIIIFKIGSCDK